MSYCTIAEVAADFKNIEFTANSSVTDSEVQAIIDQESAYIDGRICHLYKTSVDELFSPISFKILKRICIFLASDRVRHILYTKTGMEEKDQYTKGYKSLSRDPRSDLDEIHSGKLKLCDAEKIEESIGFDTASEPNDCCSNTFDVNKQQW